MDKNTEKEMFDLFKGFLDSIDFKYHYEDSDGNVIDYPKRETNRTCDCKKDYNAPKTEIKEDKKSAETVDALKKLLSEKYKEINELKKKNKELLDLNKQSSDLSHKTIDEGKKQRDLIRKRIYADGYRLAGEIKSYIEFARECEMFGDVNFTEPLNSMRKTLNDFYAIRNTLFFQ